MIRILRVMPEVSFERINYLTSSGDIIINEQKNLYSRQWGEYAWDGERLYPPLLPLGEILKGSTARLHVPTPPGNYNVLGTPRSGTKWLQKIVSSLLQSDRENRFRLLFGKLYPRLNDAYTVRHFHEAIIDDFTPRQQVIFIYRDIRDAIVSGYFYIKNNLHSGTMGSTSDNFNKLGIEEGLTQHLIMYMKYRMPVMVYWLNVEAPNLVKIRYEDLLENREDTIRLLNKKLRINAGEIAIKQTIESSSWESMSGRKAGVENVLSHQRKGTSGDWRNHFTDNHRIIFRGMGGEELMKSLGYEV
jgi:hypothetical protein